MTSYLANMPTARRPSVWNPSRSPSPIVTSGSQSSAGQYDFMYSYGNVEAQISQASSPSDNLTQELRPAPAGERAQSNAPNNVDFGSYSLSLNQSSALDDSAFSTPPPRVGSFSDGHFNAFSEEPLPLGQDSSPTSRLRLNSFVSTGTPSAGPSRLRTPPPFDFEPTPIPRASSVTSFGTSHINTTDGNAAQSGGLETTSGFGQGVREAEFALENLDLYSAPRALNPIPSSSTTEQRQGSSNFFHPSTGGESASPNFVQSSRGDQSSRDAYSSIIGLWGPTPDAQGSSTSGGFDTNGSSDRIWASPQETIPRSNNVSAEIPRAGTSTLYQQYYGRPNAFASQSTSTLPGAGSNNLDHGPWYTLDNRSTPQLTQSQDGANFSWFPGSPSNQPMGQMAAEPSDDMVERNAPAPQSRSRLPTYEQYQRVLRFSQSTPFLPGNEGSSLSLNGASSAHLGQLEFVRPFSAGTLSHRRRVSPNGQTRKPTIVDELRSGKFRKYELKDIRGKVVELSGDQFGSRFIQQKLESASTEDKSLVFKELHPAALQLMTDVFGNYVIQKFFELGSQNQKYLLAKQMKGHILTLSLQMYGCRVVQKAIEHILADQQSELIKELDGNLLECVKDQHGNHVVQKAVERIPAKCIGFIMEAFHSEMFNLATHAYGCRVIQRMLEFCSGYPKRVILELLHGFTLHLVEDQYGNYVVQHVIERGDQRDRDRVMAVVKSSILSFSRHKFASNVVEKCFVYGSPKQRDELIHEILTPRADGIVPLHVMMKDQFANYVIQKLLDVTKGEQHDKLVAAIRPQLEQLKKFTYGKHLASIERLIREK